MDEMSDAELMTMIGMERAEEEASHADNQD